MKRGFLEGPAAGAAAALVILAASAAPSLAQDAWQPTSDVEIVVTVGPGTGPDTLARQIQKIWQDQGIVDQAVTVSNRPGGGGAIGLTYLNGNAGDAHHVAIAGASMISNNLAGRSPIGCEDVTPLGHLISEYIAIAVHPDSPIESAQQLMDALKADPAAYSIGIATSRGNSNHQAIAIPAAEHGVDVSKMRTVIFQAGSEARTAVMGGHIDVVPASVGSLVGQYEQGLLRLIAVSSPERLGGPMADVPTWRELGLDAVISNWRGVIGPKDLTDEQVAFWEDALVKTMEDPAFKESVDAAYQSAEWMDREGFTALCARQKTALSKVFAAMGME